MENLIKLQEVFQEVFGVEIEQLSEGFTMETRSEWDSVSHMNLIAGLEDAFDVMLDTDDILEIISFEQAKVMISKYEIQF